MLDVLRDYAESILRSTFDLSGKAQGSTTGYVLPAGIKSIEFIAEACIITKCAASDKMCPVGGGF